MKTEPAFLPKIKIHACQKIDILRFRLAVLFYHTAFYNATQKTVRQKIH